MQTGGAVGSDSFAFSRSKAYSNQGNVFQAETPRAIRIAETSAYGQRIFEYDPKGKAVEAFEQLVGEIINS